MTRIEEIQKQYGLNDWDAGSVLACEIAVINYQTALDQGTSMIDAHENVIASAPNYRIQGAASDWFLEFQDDDASDAEASRS